MVLGIRDVFYLLDFLSLLISPSSSYSSFWCSWVGERREIELEVWVLTSEGESWIAQLCKCDVLAKCLISLLDLEYDFD